MPRDNKYKKAWNILKSKKIDERLECLDEGPTNSTSGAYIQTPGNYSSNSVSPDLNVPGAITSVNPDDQDLSGTDVFDLVTKNTQLDLDVDDPEQNGQDTSGLFYEDGTSRAIEPPGDTTAILGPMISMWYAWANYTQIGYVRESDRKMVNLGRITGELENWDGESGFTSYGQLTVEQAAWYKDQDRADYRAFYPGPPSNPADDFGRYLGSIVTSGKDAVLDYLRKTWIPSVNNFLDASDIFSLILGTNDSILTDIFSNSSLGKQGLVFLGYLTNQLGDAIDNNFLGQDYVNSSFENMKLGYDNNGKLISSVGDNIIGSGQYPKYNPETNEIEVEFNYDFKKNIDEFKGKKGLYGGMFGEFQKLIYNALGPYSVDASVGPAALGPITGGIFSAFINSAKGLGGGKPTPGKVTISPQELQKLNPGAYKQLMNNGTVPADASSKPSQNKEVSKDGIKLDPKKILDTVKQNAPPELKMALDPSMDNFNKLSPKAQSEIMKNMEKQFMSNYSGSNYDLSGAGKVEKQYYKDRFSAMQKEAGKTKFKDGYMITKLPSGSVQRSAIFPKSSKSQIKNHYKPEEGRLLTESRRKSILKNVKKPVPELPENKIKYKSSGRDSKGNKTIGKGLMPEPDAVKNFNPAKKPPSVWGKGQRDRNIRSSQEKKNEVLELIGEGDYYWEKLIEKNQRGFDNSKKRIEEENERISEMIADEMQSQYETHMIKERKLDKLKDIVKKYDYPDKPSKAGYPNDPPPEPIDGYHPDLVNIDKKANYYNGLDPQSARAMPQTASKVIDAKVRAAARKAKIKGERRPNTPNK